MVGLSADTGTTQYHDIQRVQACLPVAETFPYDPLDAIPGDRVAGYLA